MSYNVPEFALETAFESYLGESLSVKVPIKKERELTEPTYPVISIGNTVAIEEVEDTATYTVDIDVTVKSDIEAKNPSHVEICGAVMDLIFNTGLIAALNNDRADYLFIQRVEKVNRITNVDDMIVTTTQTLRVLCSMSA